MKSKRFILFACIGNTCRSPMAETIARSMFKTDIDVTSRGLDVIDENLNPKLITVIKEKLKIDIGHQKPRSILDVDLNEFDTIYSMDEMITSYLIESNKYKGQIVEFLVEDPFGGGIEKYYRTYDEIYQKLKSMSNENGFL